jgi:hypothetical protein
LILIWLFVHYISKVNTPDSYNIQSFIQKSNLTSLFPDAENTICVLFINPFRAQKMDLPESVPDDEKFFLGRVRQRVWPLIGLESSQKTPLTIHFHNRIPCLCQYLRDAAHQIAILFFFLFGLFLPGDQAFL